MRKKVNFTKQQKIKVLLIEVDYHLIGLFDAMGAKNARAINAEKRKLRELYQQLDTLDYWTSEV